MTILQLTQVGEDSVGLILPEELLVRLNWKAGDTVLLAKSANGFSLSRPTDDFEEQMKIGRKIMRKRWGVLRALAKSDTQDPS
ncbi:AbrB/MazE/SpoVT family DNA-binding domain-containing protein [Variovorax sp. MHTC-1]|uniref:AbrB/MazE/SpoVT family DNA-binding domain-containing protein n=1 Tax=Variovorax sp. MHTC-1 TaxID=2495593 RepID=UPI000F88CC9F|nr:AbrB/MazE/SpoVT family DNA-binding domain-containing protein [Variovorax sp. MHTC-1]RST51881.1 AbrB/MazE/SpoVT family DNA-binding domain-containing protein [Variovorax sp. MHTC-1]